MFVFDWIILKKTSIRKDMQLLSVFAKDYWKIWVWSKNTKTSMALDIWNVYNFCVKNDNWINKIDSVKTKKIISLENLNYKMVSWILNVCNLFEKNLPYWQDYNSLFDDYLKCVFLFEGFDSNRIAISFLSLKIIKKLWISRDPAYIWHINLSRIYNVIDIYWIDSILKINWLKDDDYNAIDSYVENTIINYLY